MFPFRAPTRKVPRLAELDGYLVQFEAFRFEAVPMTIRETRQMIDRMSCAVTVLAPPPDEAHMAVTIDGRDHVLPATFGTREAPMYVTSGNVVALCQVEPRRCGRLYLMGSGPRRWWTMTPEAPRSD